MRMMQVLVEVKIRNMVFPCGINWKKERSQDAGFVVIQMTYVLLT